jgi:urease accessory protein
MLVLSVAGEETVSGIASSDLRETFAANRARGHIALSVGAVAGRTRPMHVAEEGSLRVRFPNPTSDECEAVLINTAGGIAGGDRLDLAFDVATNARLVVTSAAAEKIYRSTGDDASIALTLRVDEGGALRWVPQETILFDNARLMRSIDVDLARGAALVLAETIVFGRAASGETVARGRLFDRWRIRREGRLIFAENLRLDGAVAKLLAEPAIGAEARAIATLLTTPADDANVAAVRACAFAGEAAISAWNGFAIARLCAADGATLRRDLALLLAALDTGALPRLWLN